MGTLIADPGTREGDRRKLGCGSGVCLSFALLLPPRGMDAATLAMTSGEFRKMWTRTFFRGGRHRFRPGKGEWDSWNLAQKIFDLNYTRHITEICLFQPFSFS